MKVLVPYQAVEGYESGERFNWCIKDELLYYSEFNTSHRNYLIGINSNKGCTHFLVKEMNISEDFFTELIIARIESAFETLVNDDLTYEIEVGFSMNFNLKELVGKFISAVNKFELGDVLCITNGDIIKSDE